MFTISFDKEYDIVTLSFSNGIIDIECVPEDSSCFSEDGFDSSPSNGEFSFVFNKETITFNIAKHGDGRGGSFSISLKMTEEIYESLENVMKKWREYYNSTFDDICKDKVLK